MFSPDESRQLNIDKHCAEQNVGVDMNYQIYVQQLENK